jgi:molecular chaperone DnaK (HSP70)
LGLDKAVPHARLQTVTRAPTEKKHNKSIVEKNSSEKPVRINELTTKKDNQPVANVPLFDDEWEREGKEQPPDK